MIQPEWWQDFFTGSVLDFVHESRDEEQTHTEAYFVEQALGIPESSRILDVPCVKKPMVELLRFPLHQTNSTFKKTRKTNTR